MKHIFLIVVILLMMNIATARPPQQTIDACQSASAGDTRVCVLADHERKHNHSTMDADSSFSRDEQVS